MRRIDPLLRPVKKHHKRWLRNVQNSIDMKCAFDYVDITPKRIDILVDMGLIEFIDGKYQLTELGKSHIE